MNKQKMHKILNKEYPELRCLEKQISQLISYIDSNKKIRKREKMYFKSYEKTIENQPIIWDALLKNHNK